MDQLDQLNYNTVEKDIERLGKEVAEKQKSLEYRGLSEKELIKQTLKPIIKSGAVSQPSVAAGAQPASDNQTLPNYLKDSPAEIKLQVKKLVDSVFHQGIEKAVKEASKNSAFILDAFHDALTDKLYDELKKRKLI